MKLRGGGFGYSALLSAQKALIIFILSKPLKK
jgi:hypothetical protein